MTTISASLSGVAWPLWRDVARHVSRLGRLLGEFRSKKSALKRILIARRKQLRPGWYRLEPGIAYLIGAPAPKGLRQSLADDPWKRQHPVKARVVRALFNAVPPVFVKLKGAGGAKAKAASQLLVSSGGSIRLFSPSSRTVTTYHSDEREAARVLMAHAALSDSLPVVGMRGTADGNVTTEPLIDGRCLFVASPDDQIKAYRRLLGAYITHTASAERTFWSRDTAEEELNAALNLRLPPELRVRLLSRRPSIIDGLHASPAIISHGDLHSKNILLVPSGPVIIDIEDACYQRFFYDPLSLPYSEATDGRPFLLNSVRAGVFDEEFHELLTAADVRGSVGYDLLWTVFLVVEMRSEGLHANTPASRVRLSCAPLLETGLV